MTFFRRIPALVGPAVGLVLVTGCVAISRPDVSRFLEPEMVAHTSAERPAQVDPDACYDRDVTPAVIETVTEQVIVTSPDPMKDGTLQRPTAFRTETHQKIVKDRREIWFETVCPETMTPAFTASLQRALAVRGHYRGEITGQVDSATRAAVRAFQRPEGLASSTLSVAAAKRLGLAVYHPGEALPQPPR